MIEIHVRSQTLLRWLVAGLVVMVVLHALSYVPVAMGTRTESIHLFNFGGEQNLPALFSTQLLFLSAVLLWVVASGTPGRDRIYWAALSAIFLFLGVDESTSLHERWTRPIREYCGMEGICFYGWIIPYGIVLVLLAAVFLRFLFRQPPRTRNRIILAGSLYVGGAVGAEALSGLISQHLGFGWVYEVILSVEETLEMVGIIVFVGALLDHINRNLPGTRLLFVSDP